MAACWRLDGRGRRAPHIVHVHVCMFARGNVFLHGGWAKERVSGKAEKTLLCYFAYGVWRHAKNDEISFLMQMQSHKSRLPWGRRCAFLIQENCTITMKRKLRGLTKSTILYASNHSWNDEFAKKMGIQNCIHAVQIIEHRTMPIRGHSNEHTGFFPMFLSSACFVAFLNLASR